MNRTPSIERICNAMERRAIEQAKRVPWRRLAETADEYSDWQLFTLWVRARVDVAKHVPAAARSEMERRAGWAIGTGETGMAARTRVMGWCGMTLDTAVPTKAVLAH